MLHDTQKNRHFLLRGTPSNAPDRSGFKFRNRHHVWQEGNVESKGKNEIHKGQHGQPGGKCADADFSKFFFTQMVRLSRMSMGQFDSNAAACFDRTVVSVALLCFHT